jgi:hypothetical protein
VQRCSRATDRIAKPSVLACAPNLGDLRCSCNLCDSLRGDKIGDVGASRIGAGLHYLSSLETLECVQGLSLIVRGKGAVSL